MASTSPIAVLDSGAGGLSVVKALRTLLPHEAIHYFADTAHLPYGTKSPELIKFLALRMASQLKQLSNCKVLVVACHTISTLCLSEIEDLVGVPVIGMVEPSIFGLKQLVAKDPRLTAIGIISTRATVLSGAYQKCWSAIDPASRVTLTEAPMGSFVSLVEEPDMDFAKVASVVEQVFPPELMKSDALLIGCTHFSALVPVFAKVLPPNCRIIDGALFVAEACGEMLTKRHERTSSKDFSPIVAYVTDNPGRFQIIASRFIEENLMIEWLRNYART